MEALEFKKWIYGQIITFALKKVSKVALCPSVSLSLDEMSLWVTCENQAL